MDIAVATRNRKKVEEIGRIMTGLPIALHSLAEFPDCPEVVEDADTFVGNALKKAHAVAAYTKMAALADDSGIAVDALGGAPGVFSARYAGEGAADADNLGKLLSDMEGVPADKRTGRFICVIALAWPDGSSMTFDGAVEGAIGTAARGVNGFGYDPVFFPEGHDRTFAEMSASEKDSMSHRGRALFKLREFLLAR